MPHLQTHFGCRTVLRLALLLLAPFCIALGGENENAFALYAEVQKDAPGAVAFSFQSVFTKERVAGFYSAPSILTNAHVNAAGYGYPEAGSQPWPTLKIYFTKPGIQRLSQHFKLKPETKLVLFMEGRAYSQLDADLIRSVIKGGWIGVYLPRTPNEHEDLLRLAKKLAKPPKKK